MITACSTGLCEIAAAWGAIGVACTGAYAALTLALRAIVRRGRK